MRTSNLDVQEQSYMHAWRSLQPVDELANSPSKLSQLSNPGSRRHRALHVLCPTFERVCDWLAVRRMDIATVGITLAGVVDHEPRNVRRHTEPAVLGDFLKLGTDNVTDAMPYP